MTNGYHKPKTNESKKTKAKKRKPVTLLVKGIPAPKAAGQK